MTVNVYARINNVNANLRDLRTIGQVCAILAGYIREPRKKLNNERDYSEAIVKSAFLLIGSYHSAANPKKKIVIKKNNAKR